MYLIWYTVLTMLVIITWGDLRSLRLHCKTISYNYCAHEDYIQEHDGGLFTTIRNETDNPMDKRMTIDSKQKERKQLYGYFKLKINNISHEKTWTWLWKESFKRET